MRIECKECGCTPKPDEWAYEGSNYCIDCGNQSLKKIICSACKGNGYQIKNMVETHQCKKCKSQGEVYA